MQVCVVSASGLDRRTACSRPGLTGASGFPFSGQLQLEQSAARCSRVCRTADSDFRLIPELPSLSVRTSIAGPRSACRRRARADGMRAVVSGWQPRSRGALCHTQRHWKRCRTCRWGRRGPGSHSPGIWPVSNLKLKGPREFPAQWPQVATECPPAVHTACQWSRRAGAAAQPDRDSDSESDSEPA